MKIAVFADIHDNLARWTEVKEVLKAEKIKVGICCGDVTSIETLEEVAKSFEVMHLALGNGDYQIKRAMGLIPENVECHGNVGLIMMGDNKVAFCHYDWLAKKLFESKNYNVIFYGHTHTPWEKRDEGYVLINPGEIAGQFGQATFAIFDFDKMEAELKLIS